MLADSSLTTCARADGHTWTNYTFLTQKERDNETGLDFSEARYYASTQGRFTSTDPIMITADRLIDPQEINLFNYARNNPGKLSYGSSGIGSSTHLFGELFKVRTDTDIAHVPYRGQGPALTDLIGGQLQVMFPIAPDVISHVRANQVRALALAAVKSSGVLPGVPLMPQLGQPDLVASAWTALYAPAHTPPAVIERLRTEVRMFMLTSAFVERMNQAGIEIRAMPADEFETFTRQERDRWAKTINALKLKIE